MNKTRVFSKIVGTVAIGAMAFVAIFFVISKCTCECKCECDK
jgi:hypothetical protein